MFLWFCSA